MKIILVIGNRPQFVKAAALWRAVGSSGFLEKENNSVKIVHTGQHYDANMSDIFFQEMGLPAPDYQLGVGGCEQGAMTGRILEGIEKILLAERPDFVVVFGDTNSTLAGALAAAKLHIPVAHIEAGLRCFNKKVPEEINRVLTDHCSSLLFTPTKLATEQLIREGLSKDIIFEVGDIMFDCFLYYGNLAEKRSKALENFKVLPKQYVLTTIHRAENADDPQKLNEIVQGLLRISDNLPVIFPLHPRTKKMFERLDLPKNISNNFILSDPLGYLDMVQLEKNAQMIVTDSGGVQKEAYFCKVPCIIARNETEWKELVEHKYSMLVPPDRNSIYESYNKITNANYSWNSHLYGDGATSEKIMNVLEIS